MIERDFLTEADRAERAGDPIGAALALRRHLERHADDGPARLRFARLLMAAGEHAAARQALAPLERTVAVGMTGLGREVERTLAELDEADGAVLAAAGRWERLLADDVDDAQARARLDHLRPLAPSPLRPGSERSGAAETLVSPEGVEALRYRLVRELGRGATATVYLARDEGLELSVALKILHPQLAGSRSSQVLSRFLAGARLLAGLRHPGVVAVYDVDEPARALAMECADTPSSAIAVITVAMKSCRASGSSIAIGSSSTSRCGCLASARVSASCACWPPDSQAGPAAQRDAQVAQPGLGVRPVEAAVQVAGHVQQVGGGEDAGRAACPGRRTRCRRARR